jgi:hypothetical protein
VSVRQVTKSAIRTGAVLADAESAVSASPGT